MKSIPFFVRAAVVIGGRAAATILARQIGLLLVVLALGIGPVGRAHADIPLYYGGDWYGNGTGTGTTSNIDQSPYTANLYQEFVVPTGQTWTVTGLFSNDLVDPAPSDGFTGADWTIRSGVSTGNGGTVVASGTGASVTITPTGRAWGSYQEETFMVSTASLVLTAGTYWMNVAPAAPSGWTYNTLSQGTNSVNAGPPPGYSTDYYYEYINGTGIVQDFVSSGGGLAASDGVLGISVSAVPEPSTSLLSILGALCLGGYAWHRRGMAAQRIARGGKRGHGLPALVLSALILSLTASESGAQSVAYDTHGTGTYSPATGDYGGVGVGTHLGRLTFSGNLALSPTADRLVYDFVLTVPQETVAADGDTLLFSGSGQVEFIPLDTTYTTFVAIWEGDFVVVGGTDRFAGAQPADQPLRVVAINDPFTLLDPELFFSWEVTGRIVLH